jgi:hypothetical protein
MNCLCICIRVLLFVRKIYSQIFSLPKQQNWKLQQKRRMDPELDALLIHYGSWGFQSYEQMLLQTLLPNQASELASQRYLLCTCTRFGSSSTNLSHILSDPIQPPVWFSDHLLCIITRAHSRSAPDQLCPEQNPWEMKNHVPQD